MYNFTHVLNVLFGLLVVGSCV